MECVSSILCLAWITVQTSRIMNRHLSRLQRWWTRIPASLAPHLTSCIRNTRLLMYLLRFQPLLDFPFVLWPAYHPSSRRLCPCDTALGSLTPSKGHLPGCLPHPEPAVPLRSLASFEREGIKKTLSGCYRGSMFLVFFSEESREIHTFLKENYQPWMDTACPDSNSKGF